MPRQSIRTACEDILRCEKDYNIRHAVAPRETAIADRLLGRGPELAEAYAELHAKLSEHPGALRRFLQVLLNCAAYWDAPALLRAREARLQLQQVNASIRQHAAALAELLEQRSQLRNASALSDGTLYHPVALIAQAGRGHHRFEHWVEGPLGKVRSEFDLKYWPTLADLMRALADDAGRATVEATDPLTEAGISSRNPSLSDAFRALLAAIEEACETPASDLPTDFRLSDASLASLMSCALDLGPDQLVDAAYVKGIRQRDRKRRTP